MGRFGWGDYDERVITNCITPLLLLIVGCSNNSKLSLVTDNIIKSLDDPLTIKVYFSDDLPAELGNTRRYLVNLLEEYEAVSRKINFCIFDHSSDSEFEEQAKQMEFMSKCMLLKMTR